MIANSPPAFASPRSSTGPAAWRERYRGAMVDARGNEIPITEQMIRRALAEAEPFSQPRSPTPRR